MPELPLSFFLRLPRAVYCCPLLGPMAHVCLPSFETMVPEVDATKNLAPGVATAGYKGYQAMAVALSARVTSNLKVKVGAGISSATTTVGAGASYQW